MNGDTMKKICIKVPEAMLDGLKKAHENNANIIREEVLERMHWDDIEVFMGDLLRYGILKVVEDEGVEFIELIRNERDPIFVEQDKESFRLFKDGVDMFR